MEIILYSTNCPRCMVLEKKLQNAGIQYELNTDVDEMLNLGLFEAPNLKINGVLYNFKEAINWIGAQCGK